MRLDTSAFEKALRQLERSMSYLHSELSRQDEGLREQFRAASIQAFEYTYELAVKMIRRQLAQIVTIPAELRHMTYPDLIRTAAESGLVRDVSDFKRYRELRNITSHTYEEERAEEVLSILDEFIRKMNELLTELQKRNHDQTD